MVTPFYAAALGLFFLGMSARVVRMRARTKVSLGSGDDRALERAIRAHANCAEYAPLTLLLIFFVEHQTQSAVWAHALAGTLVLGRLLHAWGVSQLDEDLRVRTAGMVLTLSALGGASLSVPAALLL